MSNEISAAETKANEVPLWEKPYLTLEEAAAFFHIGIHRLRELSNADDCDFVVWIGSKRLFKRSKFEKFVDSQFSLEESRRSC